MAGWEALYALHAATTLGACAVAIATRRPRARTGDRAAAACAAAAAGLFWVLSNSRLGYAVWVGAYYGRVAAVAQTSLLSRPRRAALVVCAGAAFVCAWLPPPLFAGPLLLAVLVAARAQCFVPYLRPDAAPGQPFDILWFGVSSCAWLALPSPATAMAVDALVAVLWLFPDERRRWGRGSPPGAEPMPLSPTVYDDRVVYCWFTGLAFANGDDETRREIAWLWKLDRTHKLSASSTDAWRPLVTYWALSRLCPRAAYDRVRDELQSLGNQDALAQAGRVDEDMCPPVEWRTRLQNAVAKHWPAFVDDVFAQPGAVPTREDDV